MRQIQAKARERQAAWSEAGQPNVTDNLGGELARLFGDLRAERRAVYQQAPALEGHPYRGRTSRPTPRVLGGEQARAQRNDAIVRYGRGEHVSKVAATYGLSTTTIRNIRQRAGRDPLYGEPVAEAV